ncbi:MAG: hypothetical protein AB1801_29520 [Chloroflexota bacterium]
MTGPIDFASVQWARRMTATIQPLVGLSPADLRKLSGLLAKLADYREQASELSEPQVQIILQNLHTKDLSRLEMQRGGAFVEFSGGGFEYERFLIRDDGRVPNNRYESKKAPG